MFKSVFFCKKDVFWNFYHLKFKKRTSFIVYIRTKKANFVRKYDQISQLQYKVLAIIFLV